MFIGVLRVTLHLPGNNSLKGKRKVLRSTIDRLRAKFHVSVAEVGDNDAHKRAIIGVAVVGNEASHVDSMLAKIAGFVGNSTAAVVASIQTEVIPMEDDMGLGKEIDLLASLNDMDEINDEWEEDEQW